MQSNRRKVLQIGLGSTAAALLAIAARQNRVLLPASTSSGADAKPRSKPRQPDGETGKQAAHPEGRRRGKSPTENVRQETTHQHASRGRNVRAGKWLIKEKEITEENGKLIVHNLLPFEAFDSEEELAKRVEEGAKNNLFKLPLASTTDSATSESDAAPTTEPEAAPTTESESAPRNSKRKRKNQPTDEPSTTEPESAPITEPESAPRNRKRTKRNKTYPVIRKRQRADDASDQSD
jgi:hypothetical protein